MGIFRMSNIVSLAVASMGLAVMPPNTLRAEFQFTTVATSHATGGSGLSIPSINNDGDVVYIDTSLPIATMFVSDGLTTHPIAQSSSAFNFTGYGAGGSLFPVGVAAPAINDAGEVAFSARGGASTFYPGVLAGTQNSIVTIASGTAPVGAGGGASYFSESPQIANDGTVAVLARHLDGSLASGIFTGTGGPLVPVITSNNASAISTIDPAISRNGTIGYEWRNTDFQSPTGAIDSLYAVHNGVTTLVGTTETTSFTSLAINDLGIVVAASEHDVLQMGNAGTFATVPNPTATIQFYDTVSINDANAIAVRAILADGNSAIYVGANDGLTKLIATGDAFNGSTIAALSISREAINDRGQVTFWANLANGEQGIFVASPVPEPASIVLLMIGGGFVVVEVRRKRRKPDARGTLPL